VSDLAEGRGRVARPGGLRSSRGLSPDFLFRLFPIDELGFAGCDASVAHTQLFFIPGFGNEGAREEGAGR
jgi:hypothetical protein